MYRSMLSPSHRTIGVITKLDIRDKGTDARNLLAGKVVPLRLGYVGVVNRCQEDILLNRSVMETLRAEEKFFQSHPAYHGLAGRLGIPQPAKKLNQKSSGLSKIAVVAIVLCDVVGICLVGLLFTYCNSKFCACNNRDRHSKKRATECLCFRKHESETLSENMEHYDIVALDARWCLTLRSC
ncbi:hypothetical protein Bca52824_010171 [Brassica carinata]|uniref:Dynamin stalk domain-containing protein n=1 Tax=Brassica carinata TaxID=52824 RepID=A0A8X8BAL4_BRACI|nr:hypothetical protein Bca52824_010171 [Brassica carinata]